MDTLSALIAFSTTDTIGSVRLRKIRQHFPKVEDFFQLSSADMGFFLDTLSERALEELASMKKRGAKVQEICDQKNIHILPLGHPLYPPLLRNIPDPPYLLYARGHFDHTIPLIGVIGTRNSTPEAEEANRWFCSSFVAHGLGVISGLAQGHDSIAAESVLAAEGYTVAVMGTAIDKVYPASIRLIYDKILEYGAILSEYPPGMEGAKWRFPRRNRIVSGMSQALLVIQAPEKSGTLITVKMAMEQGRDVYTLPGDPLKEANKGSNRLLQFGAKIALTPEDIIKELFRDIPDLDTKRFLRKASVPLKEVSDSKKEEIELSLKPEEKVILHAAQDWIQADELMRAVQMDAAIFNAIVTMLEIKNLIQQKPGRLYKKVL